MDSEEQIAVAHKIRQKLNDLEIANSAGRGSTHLSTNKKKTGHSRIFGIFRTIVILTLVIVIGAAAITVSLTAFKKRQQGVNSDSEAPVIKEASLKVSQIEFNIVNDEGNKILMVRAVIKNTGNTPGTIGKAQFRAFDQNMKMITEWPSPLFAEPINPQEEQTIETSFFEPPGDIFSVTLDLEKVFSQK